MQRYRYTGPDASRDLAISGGYIVFPRMEWVDPEAQAAATGIDPRHLAVVLAGLGEDWQAEGPVKAARTRKAKTKQAEAIAPATADTSDDSNEGDKPADPAEPDEEQA